MPELIKTNKTHGARVQTQVPVAPAVNDTETVTFQTRTNEVYLVTARVMTVRTDTYAQSACYVLMAHFENDGGTLVQVGATTTIHSTEDVAGWDAALSVSGTTIVLTVTGTVAQDWLVDLDVQVLGEPVPRVGYVQ